MIFKGIGASENIWFQSADTNIMYRFILSKSSSNPGNFSLEVSHNEEWGYSFCTDDSSDYERIKYSLMETLFDCENETDMLSTVSKMIEDGFSDIIYVEA